MAGPSTGGEGQILEEPNESTPPGVFLSAELATDCARFLAEVKELAARRREAERRTPG